jgi:hypothetical protein
MGKLVLDSSQLRCCRRAPSAFGHSHQQSERHQGLLVAARAVGSDRHFLHENTPTPGRTFLAVAVALNFCQQRDECRGVRVFVIERRGTIWIPR